MLHDRQVILINRYFYPDISATSQLLMDLAGHLARNGQNVRVITGRQLYDKADAELQASETIDGITVNRIWSSRFGRSSLAGRAVDYVTFYFSAVFAVLRAVRRDDVVVTATDPPLLSVVLGPLIHARRAHLVNWLHDLFPEVATALGVGNRFTRPLYAALRWLRNRSLKTAKMNVVLGERMAERLAENGVKARQVSIIPNWSDEASVVPIAPRDNPLRREWGLDDVFVVGYSGNLGRAHEIRTLLAAMIALQEDAEHRASGPDVKFLFVGGGALYAELEREVERLRLTNALFRPYQPRESLSQSLSVADVHLAILQEELEGLIVPSKFYGIAAAGRPTLFIGDPDGEIPRLLALHRCGISVRSGNGPGLTQHILQLARDPQLCRDMGQRARRLLESELGKDLALGRWVETITQISAPSAGTHPVVAPEATTAARQN